MKILFAPASPYSAKVRMAANFTGLQIDSEAVDTNEEPDALISNNPLGKIPTLVTDDGRAIFDSRAIMQFLDRESGGKLYPSDHARRTDADVLEALCDGITDCLIAHVYERRFHPAEKVHQPWLDKQWAKASRGFDYLQDNPPSFADGLNGGHFSLAAMIGYLSLRFKGEWEERWPGLSQMAEAFEEAYPAFGELRPA